MMEGARVERSSTASSRSNRRRIRPTRSTVSSSFLLFSALLATPCTADILTFSGQNALPNCAYDCSPLYAAQFACKTANDEANCFCKQGTLKSAPGICNSACTGESDRQAVSKFLVSVCGDSFGGTVTTKGAKPTPSAGSSSSSEKKETATNKALDFWQKNWHWFLIGFVCIAVPLIAWALVVPVRRYYKKKRRNTTPVVWANVGNEDYARTPAQMRQGNNRTPINRSHNTSRGSSGMNLLGVSSMIRSSSAGSASDNEAAKSFLTGSEYDAGAYAAGPVMEDSRVPSDGSSRHTVDGGHALMGGGNGYQRISPRHSPRHSQDLLSAPDRSNRYTHPQQSPVPTRQLFQPVSVEPVVRQQQSVPNRASQPVPLQTDPRLSNRVSQNPASAPMGRRRSDGQQGHRGPPAPVRMGHHLAEVQQQQQQQQLQHLNQQQYPPQQQHYQEQQGHWQQQQPQYQPQHHPQQPYDSGSTMRASTTLPLVGNPRWEQEPNHHPQHMEQRVPMMHSERQLDDSEVVDPSQIGRAA